MVSRWALQHPEAVCLGAQLRLVVMLTVSTGDCIVTSTPKANTNQDLGSRSASFSWAVEKSVLSPPSRSWTIRSERTCFWRASRNHASLGPLGIKM